MTCYDPSFHQLARASSSVTDKLTPHVLSKKSTTGLISDKNLERQIGNMFFFCGHEIQALARDDSDQVFWQGHTQ